MSFKQIPGLPAGKVGRPALRNLYRIDHPASASGSLVQCQNQPGRGLFCRVSFGDGASIWEELGGSRKTT